MYRVLVLPEFLLAEKKTSDRALRKQKISQAYFLDDSVGQSYSVVGKAPCQRRMDDTPSYQLGTWKLFLAEKAFRLRTFFQIPTINNFPLFKRKPHLKVEGLP